MKIQREILEERRVDPQADTSALGEENTIPFQQSWKFVLSDDFQGINVWSICLKHSIAAGNWNENSP